MATTEPSADTDLISLQDERSFLLRSLADLDAEHDAGDIDDDDYQSLTDDYTARAAAVLRAIQAFGGSTKGRASRGGGAPRMTGSGRPAPAGREAPTGRAAPAGQAAPAGRAAPAQPEAPTGRRRPSPAANAAPVATAAHGAEADPVGPAGSVGPRRSRAAASVPALRLHRRGQTIGVAAAVLVFGVVAAWAVTQSSGSRQPGQTISGNGQLSATTVAGGVDQRLVTAANDVGKGQVADALKLYDVVLKDDPNQPVALADGGWLEAQAGLAGNRSDLVDTGLTKIEKAEKVDPNFADAHFFRGFLLLRAKNDAPGAVTELRLYLSTVDPSAPQVASVQALLQEAIKAAGPNAPPGPNAPTTTTPNPLTTSNPPTTPPG